MKIAKFAFGLTCLPILANIATMSCWREARPLALRTAPLGRAPASLGVPAR